MSKPAEQPTGDGSGFGDLAASPDGGAAPAGGETTPADDTPLAGDNTGGNEFTLPETLVGEDGALNADAVTEHLKKMSEADAARAEQFGEVPEGDYDLALPQDITDEAGNAVSLDPDNAILKEMLPVLKEAGLGQKLVSRLLGAYAKGVMGDVQAAFNQVSEANKQAAKKEFEALGENRAARVASLRASLSDEPEGDGAEALMSEQDAKSLLSEIRTKKTFEILEALVAKLDPDAEGRVPGRGANTGGTSREAVAERLYPAT